MKFLAMLWRMLGGFEMHPHCPICGKVFYVKTMPMHLEYHAAYQEDPVVVAWRERGAPRRW